MVNIVTVEHTEKKRNFDIFREDAIYLFEIKIYQGVGQRKISWEHLGLSEQTIRTLDDNDIKPPVIKVFQGLAKKSTKLVGVRERIQRKYLVYVQPYWFVREQDLTHIVDDLNEMREMCETLRNEAIAEYELERDAFYLRIRNICEGAGLSQDEVQQAITHYMGYFPTKQRVADEFRLEISQFVRVPSLREQAQNDAELAIATTKITEENIKQQLALEYQHQIRAKMGEAVAAAKDEIYEILADSVEKLELVGNEAINSRTMTTLENALNRMKLLCNFNNDLGDIAESFGEIISTAKNEDNRDKMYALIEGLRAKLVGEINLVTTDIKGGKGHKKIAQWML